jgi:hypothetical protein
MLVWTRRLWWPFLTFLIAVGPIAYLSAIGFEPIATFIFSLPAGLFVLISWALWEGRLPQSPGAGRTLLGGSIVIGLSIVLTQWPLRLAFWAVEPTLDSLADRLERGEKVKTPLRVGTFLIQVAEMRYDSYPALTLDPKSSGPTSLVRKQEFGAKGWSKVQLSDRWYLFNED